MARFLAGQRVTAGAISYVSLDAHADSSLSLTATEQDVPGCEITFTTTRPNVDVVVTGNWHFARGSSTGTMQGQVRLDGAALPDSSPNALWNSSSSSSDALVLSTTRSTVIAAAGEHTIKLVAQDSGAAATCRVENTHLHIEVNDSVS